MSIGDNIRTARKKRGMTLEEVAQKIGVSRQTMSRYETGVIKTISLDVLEKIADAVGVEPWILADWVKLSGELERRAEIGDEAGERTFEIAAGRAEAFELGYEEGKLREKDKADIERIGLPMTRIPILGRISAGLPLFAEQNIEGYTLTTRNGGNEYFALRVVGDSMTAAGINQGNIIIVRRQNSVEDGEIAVVMVEDEDATVKRFYRAGTIVTLSPQSYNPKHLPQLYDLRKTRIRVLGKVVDNIISFE